MGIRSGESGIDCLVDSDTMISFISDDSCQLSEHGLHIRWLLYI